LSQQIPGAYQAALEYSAYYPQNEAGVLRLRGEDRQDFLQRQTTNDLQALSPHTSILTVLTSPTARILDLMRVVQEPDHLLAISMPGAHTRSFDFLKKRIFFMDRVEIEDLSSRYRQYDLLGPESGQILQRLGIEEVPPLDQIAHSGSSSDRLIVIGQDGSIGIGYRLIVSAEEAEKLETDMNSLAIKRLDRQNYQILRVESAIPGAGAELSELYNPLEVKLQRTVSQDKGCYTGQEVLARQVTYDKVARQMVSLRLDAPVEQGWALKADGRTIGAITSAALSPRFGPIALGVIRQSHLQPGITLQVVGPEETVTATVTELPFEVSS
jgi:folate-binding protein YgfZ